MEHIYECSEHIHLFTAPPWNCLLQCYHRPLPRGFNLDWILFGTAIFATLLSFFQLCWYLCWRKINVPRAPSYSKKKAYFNVKSVFQSEASVEYAVQLHMFNFLAIIFVVDNAINVHIINDKSMFKIFKPCTHKCVTTIGGADFEPEGIVTFIITIQDNTGASSYITLEDVLYFPSSPVNSISIACLADQYKDNDNIFIRTARFHSDFSWSFGTHTKTINHGQTRIPEIEVSTTKNSLHGFTTAIDVYIMLSNHSKYFVQINDSTYAQS